MASIWEANTKEVSQNNFCLLVLLSGKFPVTARSLLRERNKILTLSNMLQFTQELGLIEISFEWVSLILIMGSILFKFIEM